MGQLAKLINTASEVFVARSRHKAAPEAKARPLRVDLDIVPGKKAVARVGTGVTGQKQM
ncbi:hypothetical protein KI429_08320 [Pseudomonas shirazica]|nr:hypothetical protein KI429_08320 [Pseudomonas shirazica]